MSKIDRLVAERVMDATVCETSEQAESVAKGVPFVVPWYIESDGHARARVWMRSGCDSDTWVIGKWEPSCRIDHAWEVVEHLRKQTKDDGTRKYLVSVVDHDDGKMECVIQPGRLWTMSSCANHESAQMAICLAALRAVGVPESEIQEAMR